MYMVKWSVGGENSTPASLVIVSPEIVLKRADPWSSSPLRSRAYPDVRLPPDASRRTVPMGKTVRLNALADTLSTVTGIGVPHGVDIARTLAQGGGAA